VVAVVTYRRAELLERLLDALAPELSSIDPPARVLVVDNDPDHSARPVVDGRAAMGVTYVSEPRPGLAAARNAALDAAGDDRLLVFVDDDELPRPGWLPSLVGVWASGGCDAVAGPAFKVLDPPVPDWVTASGFFGRTPRVTGSRVVGAASNNLLLDTVRLRELGIRFDERFGLTGGEDTMMTRTLSARGGVIRWCEEAVVDDPVPRDRATRAWVLARELRTGSTWSRVHLALAESRLGRLRVLGSLTLLGAGLVVRGSLRRAAGGLSRDLVRAAGGQREVARGRGVLAGVRGRRVEEYGRSAG
jgi:succinoglycan biosynthesis protein ExoM